MNKKSILYYKPYWIITLTVLFITYGFSEEIDLFITINRHRHRNFGIGGNG